MVRRGPRRPGIPRARSRTSGRPSRSSRHSTPSRSPIRQREPGAVTSFARGAERYFDPNLQPVRRLRLVPGHHEPPPARVLRRQRLVGARRTSTPTGPPATRATSPTPSARSASSPRPAGTAFGRHLVGDAAPAQDLGAARGGDLHRPRALPADRRAELPRTALSSCTGANLHSWNAQKQLYSRSPTDATVLDYVEGMMIGAELQLCQIAGTVPCTHAESLARASLAAFPHDADWTPAADVVYLRFLLDLYRYDGDRTWYDVVYDNARRALDARALAGPPLLQALGRNAVPGPPPAAGRGDAQPLRLARNGAAGSGVTRPGHGPSARRRGGSGRGRCRAPRRSRASGAGSGRCRRPDAGSGRASSRSRARAARRRRRRARSAARPSPSST